jgi:hypothetical protein
MPRAYQGAEKPDPAKYVSRKEAAAITGWTRERITMIIASGEVNTVQRGKWVYIERASLAAYRRGRGSTDDRRPR